MERTDRPQPNIGRTLCDLLPIEGAAKTLSELKDQARLLNDIHHPDDASFGRVIVEYLRSPEHTQGVRFHRVDTGLHPEDPRGRWARVRVGPSVFAGVSGSIGPKPSQHIILIRLPDIWEACKGSDSDSFYLWDILELHFGVTKDNNSHYRSWLKMLADVLAGDSRFVMVAVDERSNIPVEWMLAVDRQRQVEASVLEQVPRIISYMHTDSHLVFLTRDLVNRFFAHDDRTEALDMHSIYQRVSAALAEDEACLRLSIETNSGPAEAWSIDSRAREHIKEQCASLYEWMLRHRETLSAEAVLNSCVPSVGRLELTSTLDDMIAEILNQDPRFLPIGNGNTWEPIPAGPNENAAAYRILLETHFPQTELDLVEQSSRRFPGCDRVSNLSQDPRFRSWRDDLWGLSRWIDVSDQAMEILRKGEGPLEQQAIIDAVCSEYGIPHRLAVFDPRLDDRFVRLPDGRWHLAYRLRPADLDKMLGLLLNSDVGHTLDDLVSRALGLDGDRTDAAERLSQDDRFILREGLWFAKELLYVLTNDDLNALLAELNRARTGLRLTTLLARVLDRDADRTDAAERLQEDDRFREFLPGVWVSGDIAAQYGDRRPVANLAFRSGRFIAVSEEEFLAETETLTLRVTAEQEDDGSADEVSRTLSLADVDHGSLRMSSILGDLLGPQERDRYQAVDELGNEFTCWHDAEADLLCGFAPWFELRGLTYGDRILITSGDEDGFLQVVATGRRDEKVHKEALQHKDLDRVLKSARDSGKSFHDLLIEVLRHFNEQAGKPVPVHREIIFGLVNKMRIANRNTIFALLSLPQCPYEELRYFVKHGKGYWSYDPDIHRAYVHRMSGSDTADHDVEDGTTRIEPVPDADDDAETLGRDSADHTKEGGRESEVVTQTWWERIAALERELLELTEKAEADSKLIAVHQKKNDLLEGETETAQAEVAALRKRYDRATGELAQEVATVTRNRDALLKHLATAKDKLDEAVGEAKQSKEQVTELQKQYARERTKVNELEHLNEQYRHTAADLGTEVTELRMKIGALRSELDSVRRNEADLKSSLAEEQRLLAERAQGSGLLEDEQRSLLDENAGLIAQVRELQETAQEQSAKIRALELDLDAAREEKEGLRKESVREMGDLGRSISSLVATKDAQAELLFEARSRLLQLQRELDDLRAEHRVSTDNVNRLEDKMESVSDFARTGRGRILDLLSRLLGGPGLLDG